jgi:hypothetical protein
VRALIPVGAGADHPPSRSALPGRLRPAGSGGADRSVRFPAGPIRICDRRRVCPAPTAAPRRGPPTRGPGTAARPDTAALLGNRARPDNGTRPDTAARPGNRARPDTAARGAGDRAAGR